MKDLDHGENISLDLAYIIHNTESATNFLLCIWDHEKFPRKPFGLPINFCLGAPRIELGPYAPKAYILPLYYAPRQKLIPKHIYYRYTTPRDIL